MTTWIGLALAVLLAGCGDNNAAVLPDAAPPVTQPPDAGLPVVTPQHVLLFGGVGADGTFLDDTWTWDGTSWTRHDVPGPSARWGTVGGVLDGKVLLFGGVGDGDNPNGGSAHGDTWIWDGTAWTQLDVPGPPARGIAQGGTLDGTFVLFGGYGDLGGVNDTWTWDGAAWTQRLASDPLLSAMDGRPNQDLGMATATYGGAFLVTDGVAVWTWSGSQWTGALTPGPSYREGPSVAVLGDNVVMFGGAADTNDGEKVYDETWSWNGAVWTQSIQAAHPSARASAGMVSYGDRVLLFGGEGASGVSGDTWTFDGTTWTQLEATGPSARDAMLMVAY